MQFSKEQIGLQQIILAHLLSVSFQTWILNGAVLFFCAVSSDIRLQTGAVEQKCWSLDFVKYKLRTNRLLVSILEKLPFHLYDTKISSIDFFCVIHAWIGRDAPKMHFYLQLGSKYCSA